MVSNACSFSGCLEFVSKSNVPPSVGLDVCRPKQPRYIFFIFRTRVPTTLHFPIAYIDISLGR